MSDRGTALRILDDAIDAGVRLGIGQRIAEDARLDGRQIRLGGRDLLNFASCSYLGLEMHPDLRRGVIDAVERFGTQFSSSRVYVSAPLYAELEELLEVLFDAYVIATPSTSLGHLSSIPTLVDDDDAVVLDHQVHHSVQTAVRQVASSGTRVEIVRHGRMDQLEERVAELSKEVRKVWYLADGVYSMYGDFAPFSEIEALLGRYEQMHVYVDDAHGMSWSGKNGRGVALSHMALHPRMVMATSLNKSFAAGGGVLVFPDGATRRRVRNCGGPLLFSGPIQPPMLGAAVASAHLHLSPAIHDLQSLLSDRIAFCDAKLAESGLPVLSAIGSPIKFVGAGVTAAAQQMVALLMERGFYPNVAQFPAVSQKRGGVRFTVTLHQREEDIEAMVDALSVCFDRVVGDAGSSRDEIFRTFGLASADASKPTVRSRAKAVRLEVARSIADVPVAEWDPHLSDRGAFESAALRALEDCFSARQQPHNAWRFTYYRGVDDDDRTRLATFFTETPWKADMLASDAVSRIVEERRRSEPDFLVLRALMMGSLLTEGDPLYVAPGPGASREDLVNLLLDAVEAEGDERDVDLIVLRDLSPDDEELDRVLRDRDFVKITGPDRMVAVVDWADDAEFMRRLSNRGRRHQHRNVAPFNDFYEVEIVSHGGRNLSHQEVSHLHGLYRQVKARNLEINSFELPEDLLSGLLGEPGWEVAIFRLAGDAGPPVAFVATFVAQDHTVPTIVGLDYRYVEEHGLYRQCVRHVVLRARELGRRRVHFGFGASYEKMRFGAHAERTALYMQIRDPYPLDVLAQLSEGAAR